jgi:ribosomal protein S18 acetylase RimI-like enzyme
MIHISTNRISNITIVAFIVIRTCAHALSFVSPSTYQCELSGYQRATSTELSCEGLSLNLRRAHPDEIDYLSQIVARCFVKSSNYVNDNAPAPIAACQSLQYKSDYFVTRWTVYAGMVQRLVESSFKKGLEEGKGDEFASSSEDSFDDGESVIQPLFVAEITRVDRAKQIGQENNKPEIVGLVEVACADCPIPFNLGTESTRKAPFLCNLAVLPEFQGNGFGKALLSYAEEFALTSKGLHFSLDVPISEIYLETNYDNHAALKMYQSNGYVCEGIDPEVRQHRCVYMRKRFTEESPAYSKDILCITEVEGKCLASYDFAEDDECIVKQTFIEANFGTLAPLVAALGAVVGVILF